MNSSVKGLQKLKEESKDSKTSLGHSKTVLNKSFDQEIEEMGIEAESDKGVSAKDDDDEFDELLEGAEEDASSSQPKLFILPEWTFDILHEFVY